MLNRSKLMWVAGALLALAASGVGCGSSGSGNTSSSGASCVPNAQQSCACLAGKMGIQICGADGHSFGACDCSSGTGGAGGTTVASSSSSQMSTCGDGIPQAGECGPEGTCPQDCGGMGGADAGTTTSSTTTTTTTTGAGGACAGHVYYAGKSSPAISIWGSVPGNGGLTGLDAGNSICQGLNIGADHVCDYEEVRKAETETAFMAIPAGTSAWVQRTTTVSLIGTTPVPTGTAGSTPSAPGPGGRCNDWTYMTNHISDGEYITFATAGMPTYHLDNDTIFDSANPGLHTLADLPCNGAGTAGSPGPANPPTTGRVILCCYQACN